MSRAVQPNFVNGTGDGAVFPGGAEIPAVEFPLPPEINRSIRWVRESNGYLVAEIYGRAHGGDAGELLIRAYNGADTAEETLLTGDNNSSYMRIMGGMDGHMVIFGGYVDGNTGGSFETYGHQWSSGKVAVGQYRINIAPGLVNTPAVVAICAQGLVGRVAEIYVANPTTVEVRTFNPGVAVLDTAFTFIGIGRQA